MTSSVRIHIKPRARYTAPLRYTLDLISRHFEAPFQFVDKPEGADLLFDHEAENTEVIAVDFYRILDAPSARLSHHIWMRDGPWILDDHDKKDLLATIFYMVNCLQERNAPATEIDQFGRFKYSESYQARFDCIADNLVMNYIRSLSNQWELPLKPAQPSKVHISHDIDALRGSLLQTTWHLLKSGRLNDALRKFLTLKPRPYDNLVELEAINESLGVTSTYFFIPQTGYGQFGIKNADYGPNTLKRAISVVGRRNNEVGLHKSSSRKPIVSEMEALGTAGQFNRYHFLAHRPHIAWAEMDEAGISVDCSLGFAEHYGFRNSYGFPFRPYNFEKGTAMNLVVSPLHIMDGTLWSYMHLPATSFADQVTSFLNEHREDALISILWHNTSITDIPHAGLRKAYCDILKYLDQNEVATTLCSDILKEYGA